MRFKRELSSESSKMKKTKSPIDKMMKGIKIPQTHTEKTMKTLQKMQVKIPQTHTNRMIKALQKMQGIIPQTNSEKLMESVRIASMPLNQTPKVVSHTNSLRDIFTSPGIQDTANALQSLANGISVKIETSPSPFLTNVLTAANYLNKISTSPVIQNLMAASKSLNTFIETSPIMSTIRSISEKLSNTMIFPELKLSTHNNFHVFDLFGGS
jgi:hypothetical protein